MYGTTDACTIRLPTDQGQAFMQCTDAKLSLVDTTIIRTMYGRNTKPRELICGHKLLYVNNYRSYNVWMNTYTTGSWTSHYVVRIMYYTVPYVVWVMHLFIHCMEHVSFWRNVWHDVLSACVILHTSLIISVITAFRPQICWWLRVCVRVNYLVCFVVRGCFVLVLGMSTM